MNKKISKVGIVGSGTMGSGIAQLVASSGFEVVLVDLTEEFLNKAISRIEKSLSRLVEKEKISKEAQDKTISKINLSTILDYLSECDLVIEAVSENIEIKKEVFSKLDDVLQSEVVIASNTSTIPIIKLAKNTKRPEKIVGMHFFNPAPVMKLVEIVNSDATNEETTNIAKEFVIDLGKDPVITKDRPGFIVNRILLPMLNEAAFAFEEGMGSAEDIDKAMKLGTNHPMGPLELMDLIGLDVTLDILDVLKREFNDEKYSAAPKLRQMVEEGNLGRKSGKGFYDYSK